MCVALVILYVYYYCLHMCCLGDSVYPVRLAEGSSSVVHPVSPGHCTVDDVVCRPEGQPRSDVRDLVHPPVCHTRHYQRILRKCPDDPRSRSRPGQAEGTHRLQFQLSDCHFTLYKLSY